MSSSRRSPNPPYPDRGHEPFPDMPTPGPSSPQDQLHTTTSHTTTTTTILNGRDQPRTTTTSRQPLPRYPSDSNTPTLVYSNDPDVVPYTRNQVTVPHQIRRRPISIRRLPSATNRLSQGSDGEPPSRSGSQRGRSTSAPQQPQFSPSGTGSQRLSRQGTRQGQQDLPTLREEASQPQQMAPANVDHLNVPGQDANLGPPTPAGGVSRRRSLSNAARSVVSRLSAEDHAYFHPHEYETEVVDMLDVIGMSTILDHLC